MQINFNELRKQLRLLIDPTVSAVYFSAEPTVEYPYAVFELKELQTTDERTQMRLEINVFSRDSREVEDLADSLAETFDYCSFTNNKLSFYTYREARNRVIEEDKNVHRIRLTFELEAYFTEA